MEQNLPREYWWDQVSCRDGDSGSSLLWPQPPLGEGTGHFGMSWASQTPHFPEHRAKLAHKACAHRPFYMDVRLDFGTSSGMEKWVQEQCPLTLCFCPGLSTDSCGTAHLNAGRTCSWRRPILGHVLGYHCTQLKAVRFELQLAGMNRVMEEWQPGLSMCDSGMKTMVTCSVTFKYLVNLKWNWNSSHFVAVLLSIENISMI